MFNPLLTFLFELYSNSLTSLPDSLFSSLTKLTFIQQHTSPFLHHFHSFSLELSDNSLESVSSDWFTPLTQLTDLSISSFNHLFLSFSSSWSEWKLSHIPPWSNVWLHHKPQGTLISLITLFTNHHKSILIHDLYSNSMTSLPPHSFPIIKKLTDFFVSHIITLTISSSILQNPSW